MQGLKIMLVMWFGKVRSCYSCRKIKHLPRQNSSQTLIQRIYSGGNAAHPVVQVGSPPPEARQRHVPVRRRGHVGRGRARHPEAEVRQGEAEETTLMRVSIMTAIMICCRSSALLCLSSPTAPSPSEHPPLAVWEASHNVITCTQAGLNKWDLGCVNFSSKLRQKW